MADNLLDQLRDVVEGQIDFEGQKNAEVIATLLLVISGGVAFVVGYLLQDIKLALYITLAGAALSFVAVVPPWPFYKRNPVRWYQDTAQDAKVERDAVGG